MAIDVQPWMGTPEKRMEYDIAERQLGSQDRRWAEQLKLYQDILGQRTQQTGSLTSIVDQYNRAFAEAKAANEAKYQQALGATEQVSGQQAADIRSDYGKQRASALQNLARSGMSGTTVGATLSQGLQREQSSSLNRLADQMLQTKLGVMKGFEYKYPETAIPQTLIDALTRPVSWPSF